MDRVEELHAAIDERPDDAASYLVLADLLQQQGDPRGEVIALWAAETVFGTRLARARTLGPPPPRTGDVDWFYGYVRSFRTYLDEDDDDVLRAFLNHPSLRHATEMVFKLGGSSDIDREWLVPAIASQPRAACRILEIDSYLNRGNDPPEGVVDLTLLWDALPRITSLVVHAREITLGALRSPTLTSLELDGRVDSKELAPLLAHSLPALRELVLPDTDPQFEAAIARAGLRAQLTKLVVTAADADRYEQTGE